MPALTRLLSSTSSWRTKGGSMTSPWPSLRKSDAVIHPLPVSRHHIVLREPNGHEEALLAEIRPGSLPARLEVVRRLAPPTDSGLDWDRLPAVDVDAALLALRRR